MSTISATSTILGSIFSTLQLSPYNWTPGEVQEAVSLINSSTLLVNELLDMQNNHWMLIPMPSGLTATDVTNGGTGSIDISYVFGGQGYDAAGTQHVIGYLGTFDVAQFFVGALAYEVGHAEDSQFNSIFFTGTDLSIGANVALELLSEGKSVVQ